MNSTVREFAAWSSSHVTSKWWPPRGWLTHCLGGT